MADRYDSLYTGQQIDDAIDRAKAGGEIDALITAMKGAGWTTETLKGLADLISNLSTNKANKAQEAWITPTLLNGWVNYNASTHSTAGYFKDEFGIVHLRGLIKSGTIDAYAFNLPPGYKPPANMSIGTASNAAFGYIGIDTTGIYISAGNNTWVSLDGITFKI